MRVLALSGSLRAQSTNSRLLKAMARLGPASGQWHFVDQGLSELPHFSPDLDREGTEPPPAVARFRQAVREADAVVIACPEYAHGVPGSFKNALDWLVSSGELGGKPVLLFGASPSGAEYARRGLRPTLDVLEAKVLVDASLVLARHDLTADDRIANPAVEAAVREALQVLSR